MASGVLEVVGGALLLQSSAFRDVEGSAPIAGLGLWIALLAGLSQAIGQGFVLFVNRVQPLRFSLALLVEAVLFLLGFLFWALSTWLVALLVFQVPAEPLVLIRALGVAHAPQLFAFLGALPYLGVPLLTALSLWTALAFVVGLVDVLELPAWDVFACLLLGWLVMHGLQRLAGQPLLRLGRRLLDRAAGVPLVRDGRQLEALLAGGGGPARRI